MRIGIDVDGVILDYINIVRTHADLYDYCELKKKGVVNKKGIKVKDRYDWTKEELTYFADKYFVSLTRKTCFNPLAIEIIKKLKEEGHQLYVISNRGLIHKEATVVAQEMFKENELPIDKYFWSIKDKTEVCLDNNIDVIIDDSPSICEDAVKNNIYALYFREKDAEKLQHELLYDVDNWGQIYRCIKDIELRINSHT